jgi:hypothetical protein
MAPSQADNESTVAEALEYYQTALENEVPHTVNNLDDPAAIDASVATVQSYGTFNFVVDFSDAAAWASFDLHPLSLAGLLESERPEVLNTRWINIWYPSQQAPLLELLAKRYDFSPRLLALMCSEPEPMRRSQSSIRDSRTSRRKFWHRQAQPSNVESDMEKGVDELSELSSITSYDSAAASNLYKIINQLWHYSSVDFGRNYVCIGYNSLYGTKHAGGDPGDGPLPHCTRVWTWLLLCEDNTVITINEDPFLFSGDHLSTNEQRLRFETRRNLVNIFRSITGTDRSASSTHTPMAQLPIRGRLGSTPEESAHRLTDVPGLLFYYLFENWQNSYTLITRRESRYGLELNSLRTQMFESPKLCHIDRLDTIGKELGVLKRHYASYNRIIDRMLDQPSATAASLQNSQVVGSASQSSLNTIRPVVAEKASMLGVSFSSAARVRFKRLRDLIDLYALSEVEEYMKQKEALVAMNFQLIAIKESLDVERLTRLGLLLTKATILFLPVSLTTAYFSVPLAGMEYHANQFWISFAVVLFMSGVTLFTFGLFSGTVQTLTVFKTVWRALKSIGQKALDKL